MRWFFILIWISFSLAVNGQNADSLAREIDSSAKTIQRSYENLGDSFYRLKMERSINEKGQELDKFLADYEEYKEKEKRRTYIRIGAVIIFAVALIYGVARKRKQKRLRKINSPFYLHNCCWQRPQAWL